MSDTIRVVSTSPGTRDWRAERADGSYLCTIRIDLSASLYGSRYYVLREGQVEDQGTFTFDVWDDDAVRDVITAIVKKVTSPNATVSVVRQPQHRAMRA